MSVIEQTSTACRLLLQSAADHAASVHPDALDQFLEASAEVLAATERLAPRAACHIVVKVRANLLQTCELLSVTGADLHGATELQLVKAQEGIDQILAAARELCAGVEQSGR